MLLLLLTSFILIIRHFVLPASETPLISCRSLYSHAMASSGLRSSFYCLCFTYSYARYSLSFLFLSLSLLFLVFICPLLFLQFPSTHFFLSIILPPPRSTFFSSMPLFPFPRLGIILLASLVFLPPLASERRSTLPTIDRMSPRLYSNLSTYSIS